MDKKRNELVYLATMAMAKKMLLLKLITAAEYKKFESEMKGKYSPETSVLFSDIDLL